MRPFRSGQLAAVAALVLGLGLLVPATTATAAPTPPPVAQGSTAGATWDVTRAAGGAFVVRLTLPTPLPFRAAPPQLAVDGVVVGTATQDRDGRTVRVRTADARVARATRVDLAWNGDIVGAPAQKAPAPAALPDPGGRVLSADPATGGRYAVQRADYDLGDTAVRLPGLGGQAVELRAAVYLPAGAPGRRPVVVFLHGRHQPCYGDFGDGPTPAWPCPPGTQPVPSHLGYGQAAEALAAAGDVVVSISADGINALDYGATDGGAEARGELVLAHLDQLAAWDAGRGGDGRLRGRLDLTDVGLMGHSRGGEGVVKAALLNAERPTPYGIRAVMPLAPVDFVRSTLPGVPMAVVLPYCDGDVSDQQGQHFYDDTRYAAADDAPRTSLLVMGADHNYFNSEWTPGLSAAPSSDDWYDPSDPVCGRDAASRLTPREQRAVGAAYISGFFRLHLNGEQQFLPLFDGTGGRAASAGRAVVYTEAQQPRSARTDLATLQGRTDGVRTTAGAVYCAGYGEAVPDRRAPCASPPRSPSTLPHWTPAYLAPDITSSPMVRMTWNASTRTQAVTVAAPALTGSAQALTFRAATAGGGRSDLDVTVADTAGRSASVRLSGVTSALTPLPALTGFGRKPAVKIWLRTVRLPLGGFTGVDLARLASVRFSSVGTNGDVYLADVAVDTPAAGRGGPSDLPVVSIGDADAFVGDAPTRAAFTVSLSRPSDVPVTVQVDVGAVDGGSGQVPRRAVQVTIPPGDSAVTVTALVQPLPDGGGGSGPVTYENTLSVPTNAIVGDAFGDVRVYSG